MGGKRRFAFMSRLSSRKAREILHHGSVKGHPLTDRQRRYFGWVASRGSRGYGGEPDLEILWLLNERTEDATRDAIAMLTARQRLTDDVRVEFSGCPNKPRSTVYPPFRTGYANAYRIHLCSDSMDDAFNALRSKTVVYDDVIVSHYAVVVLHEFGHVLDKRHLLQACPVTHAERRADWWAQEFLSKL
jgi:hypothetical protein